MIRLGVSMWLQLLIWVWWGFTVAEVVFVKRLGSEKVLISCIRRYKIVATWNSCQPLHQVHQGCQHFKKKSLEFNCQAYAIPQACIDTGWRCQHWGDEVGGGVPVLLPLGVKKGVWRGLEGTPKHLWENIIKPCLAKLSGPKCKRNCLPFRQSSRIPLQPIISKTTIK